MFPVKTTVIHYVSLAIKQTAASSLVCSSLFSSLSLRVLSTGTITPAVLNTILLTVSSGTLKSSLENTFLSTQQNTCFQSTTKPLQ